MGQRAASLFEQANSLGGLAAKMRLAALTRMTSTEATHAPDSADVVARLERALAQIRAEAVEEAWQKLSPGLAATVVSGDVVDDTALPTEADGLRRHIDSLLDLMNQCIFHPSDLDATIQRVTEAAVEGLCCQRSSVWFLTAKPMKIRCADLFVQTTQEHTTGTELLATDFPTYFAAMATERTIAAHDAHRDPRTACFSKPYLTPLGITSMLDVPIWAHGKMAGVVCNEHVGPARVWTADDERFAYVVANIVSIAIDLRKTRQPTTH